MIKMPDGKPVTDKTLIDMVGSILDGRFENFGYYIHKNLRIGIFKIYDSKTRNEYMKAYVNKHKVKINALRRRKYLISVGQGKCGRCKKPNLSKRFKTCSLCRLKKLNDRHRREGKK